VDVREVPTAFAANDVPHSDPSGGDHDAFDGPLALALGWWMQGQELDRPVHTWLESMPATTQSPDRIQRALDQPIRTGNRLVWVGGEPLLHEQGVTVHDLERAVDIGCTPVQAEWLVEVLASSHPAEEPLDVRDAIDAFPGDWADFAPEWQTVRALGALLI
jgi:hypothetical protein